MAPEEKPSGPGQTVTMRGDSVSAVSWVDRCGGSGDGRAGLLMRLLGRTETENGWCYMLENTFQSAKHVSRRNLEVEVRRSSRQS